MDSCKTKYSLDFFCNFGLVRIISMSSGRVSTMYRLFKTHTLNKDFSYLENSNVLKRVCINVFTYNYWFNFLSIYTL